MAMTLTNQKLKNLVKEEVENMLMEEVSDKKQIAYDIAEEMGLRSAYHGALKTFDGKWNGTEISIEYHGSGDKLVVFGSPANQLPSSSNTFQFIFTSSSEYEVVLKNGDEIGSFSYQSASEFANKVKELVNKNSK